MLSVLLPGLPQDTNALSSCGRTYEHKEMIYEFMYINQLNYIARTNA